MFKISDPNSSVVIELSAPGVAKAVVFPQNEERALMVGSDVRAHFRVTGVGVAPVQFHLERHDGMAWLVPAYGLGDLRVNAARVSGPLALEERNVIEFGETRIDATVLEGDAHPSASEDPASGGDAWEHRGPRSSEIPDVDDATRVAMRAITLATDSSDHQTTATVRPVDAPIVSPQQTERMAPYRPPPAGAGPALTAQGTEIMSPFRPNASAPPRLLTTERLAPVNAGGAQEPPAVIAPIVPVPVVAITLAALAKAEASTAQGQAPDSNTTLFDVPAVRLERPSADGRRADATPTPVDSLSPNPPGWSSDETVGAGAKASSPAPSSLSWLAKLGLLTKARPALVACGATAGAFVLATLLLVTTHLLEHRQPHASQTASATALPTTLPHRPPVAGAPALPAPLQIVEAASVSPVGSVSKSGASSVAAKKASNDPEVATAVSDVLAGRYSEARAAYSALSQRPGNTATYASIARLLTRATSPECSAGGQGAPKDCAGVHR